MISNDSIPDSFFAFKAIWLSISSGILLVVVLINLICSGKRISLSRLECIVSAFFIFSAINSCFRHSDWLITWTILVKSLSCYAVFISAVISVKYLDFTFSLIKIFAFVLFAQIFIGFCQVNDVIFTSDSTFKLKGFFFNPGPYSIFLSCLISFLVPFFCFFYKKMRLRFQILSFIVAAISLYLLYIAESRSAWIALACTMIFIIIALLRFEGIILRLKNLRLKIFWFFISANTLALATYHLYNFKRDSAFGRILIWQNSFKIFVENCYLGVGEGNFAVNYLKSQYDFFRLDLTNGQRYVYVAGDVRFAFNDLLQLLCEEGIIGLSFFAAGGYLIYLLCKNVYRVSRHRPFAHYVILACVSCLLALSIAGLFAYPLQLFEFKTVFLIILGILSSQMKSVIAFRYNKYSLVFLVLVGGVLIHTGLAKYRAFVLLNNLTEENAIQSYSRLKRYQGLYPALSTDVNYLLSFSRELNSNARYRNSVFFLERALRLSPDKYIYYELGAVYERIGEYERAEKLYQKIETAIPNLIYPKFLLINLYFETGKYKKVKLKAYEVENQNLKVTSALTEDIKDRIGEVLYKVKVQELQ